MNYFNSQSLATEGMKGQKLVCVMPAVKKVFDVTRDDVVEVYT